MHRPLDPKSLLPALDVDPLELRWLAGLVEGEGTFFPGPPSCPHLPVLQMAMADEDVMAHAGRLLNQKVHRVRPRRKDWQTTYSVQLVGSRAVAWMKVLRPLLGKRRRAQIDRAIASYDPQPRRLLDDNRALEALDRLCAGQSVKDVAAHFGVTAWCIYDLRLNRTHKHLPRPPRES